MSRLTLRHAIIAVFLFLFVSLPLVAGAQTETYTDPATGMEFVSIPGGTFTMGNNDDRWATPEHQVTVAPFYMGIHEVTFDQYDIYCKETGKTKPNDEGWGRGNRPVVNVTWQDAVDFAQWLSEKSGNGYRLPSEAEWEYAAKTDLETHYWWGNDVGQANANCRSCGSQWDRKMTAPVSAFEPNPRGLYNMHGNVYEWVFDTWHENYEGAPQDGSAWLFGDTKHRVSRGGSWLEIPSSLNSSARNWSPAREPRKDIGFRLVFTP